MHYCRAVMPKAGLGNRLMPWARACVYAQAHGLAMLAPQWSQLKIGPLLRGEKDLRLYHNLFQRHPQHIGGLKAAWLKRSAAPLPEPEDLTQPPAPNGKSGVFVFSEERDHFRRLNGWHEFLGRELQTITRRQWLDRAAAWGDIPIGMHIRRGDFRAPADESQLLQTGHLQVPLKWFGETVKAIRRAVGQNVRAVFTSDGTEEEMRELLEIENVERADTGSAIGDLLLLSKSRVFLASGSSFSAWASFLGQMPTATHPGQSVLWFQLTPPPEVFVGEFDPAQPDAAFLAASRRALLG
jgi:hypothetical protein